MNTKQRLADIGGNLDESMGLRRHDVEPTLSPVPHAKDVGRRPLGNVGSVDIEMVVPDPQQPRTEFDEETIGRLAESIREKGQLSPIRVRWSEGLAKWVIVAGERRWRATKRAGLVRIECYFHERDLSDGEVLAEQIIENCLREDLQPMEEARAFKRLMGLNHWTAKQLADALRLHPSKISRSLALLRLPAEIQSQVNSGQISARSAYELSKIPNIQAQRQFAAMAASGKFNHRQAARAVRQRKGKRTGPPRGTRLTFVTEEGWKVRVSSSTKSTYHEVEQALQIALEEVRHRIDNGVQIFC